MQQVWHLFAQKQTWWPILEPLSTPIEIKILDIAERFGKPRWGGEQERQTVQLATVANWEQQ
jgi:hypothetical protein